MMARVLAAFAAGMAALLYSVAVYPDDRTATFVVGGVLWATAGTAVVGVITSALRTRRSTADRETR